MLTKIIPLTGAALFLTLTGCTNTTALEEKIEMLNNKVDTISSKVDGLNGDIADLRATQNGNNTDISRLKSMVGNAINGADKANQRLDRLVDSYKK